MEQQPRPTVPQQVSTSQTVVRFLFRLALLSTFAAFGTQGFARTIAALLAMSAIFCSLVGAMRRDAIFGPTLTHWDEAAAYAVVGRIALSFS